MGINMGLRGYEKRQNLFQGILPMPCLARFFPADVLLYTINVSISLTASIPRPAGSHSADDRVRALQPHWVLVGMTIPSVEGRKEEQVSPNSLPVRCTANIGVYTWDLEVSNELDS